MNERGKFMFYLVIVDTYEIIMSSLVKIKYKLYVKNMYLMWTDRYYMNCRP